jgi:GT2 family glycosyltransferase
MAHLKAVLLCEANNLFLGLLNRMSSHQVATVVLNWNGKNDTLACLHSLQEQEEVKVKVILVDNGSVDNSVLDVSDQFPNAVVIENGANLGYAGGNNVGIRYALDQGFQYIMVLNNDTVLAPQCISRLLADLQLHPDAAAAGPKSFYFETPETIYFAGGRISRDGRTLHVGIGTQDGPKYNVPCDTEWLTGCAILFRSKSLKEVGLFEPKYYVLYEDADWSLRARTRGYRLRFVPGAALWHKTSPSIGKTWSPLYLYYYTRNNFLWIERNFSLPQKPRFYYYALNRAFDISVLGTKELAPTEKRLVRRSVWKGIVDYLFRRFGQQNYL